MPAPSPAAAAIIGDTTPLPRDDGWDGDDPDESHPRSWSFDLEHHPPAAAGKQNVRGGGCSSEGPGDTPGLRALPLPGPSAAGRGLEPRCPAPSGRWDVLIRPRAIFAARRARNPGLGRLRGWLGKLREGKSGRPGRGLARPRTRPRAWPPHPARLPPLPAALTVEG